MMHFGYSFPERCLVYLIDQVVSAMLTDRKLQAQSRCSWLEANVSDMMVSSNLCFDFPSSGGGTKCRAANSVRPSVVLCVTSNRQGHAFRSREIL